MDERLIEQQRQGRIAFHIGSVGDEALMIGSAAALAEGDWVAPSHRELGVALYRGTSVDAIVANMYGTGEDLAKGRQMPGHYVDPEHNFLSISSPVGTQIPQAAGVGWAMRLRKSSDAVAVYFGHGATSGADFPVVPLVKLFAEYRVFNIDSDGEPDRISRLVGGLKVGF